MGFMHIYILAYKCRRLLWLRLKNIGRSAGNLWRHLVCAAHATQNAQQLQYAMRYELSRHSVTSTRRLHIRRQCGAFEWTQFNSIKPFQWRHNSSLRQYKNSYQSIQNNDCVWKIPDHLKPSVSLYQQQSKIICVVRIYRKANGQSQDKILF